MKKILFGVTLLVLNVMSNPVNAQESFYVQDDNTFKGFVAAGGNFSQIDGDNYAGYSKAGINAGAGVLMMLGKDVGAGLELLYSRKGSRSNAVKPSTTYAFDILSYKAILNYVDIPLQLYYVDKRKDQFGAGLSYSRLINQSEVFDTNPAQNLKSEDYPFKKSDYCFVLTGNVHVTGGFYVSARFQYSLVSIRGNVPPGFGRTEQYNHMWTMRLMYMFNR
jgi:hypothetical protein